MLRNIPKPRSFLFGINKGRIAYKISFSNMTDNIKRTVEQNITSILRWSTHCPGCTKCSFNDKQLYSYKDDDYLYGLVDHPYWYDHEIEDNINDILSQTTDDTCISKLLFRSKKN